jgi:saccharopine dehydrogenase-like NADP-dependent oxidoreductase
VKDDATGFSAMSRTVGFTASIGAQLIASGQIAGPGVLNPLIDIPLDLVAGELGKRGIEIETTWNDR